MGISLPGNEKTRWIFKSLAAQSIHHPSGFSRPGLAVGRPAWAWGLWCHPDGTQALGDLDGREWSFAKHILPNSLSPFTV